MLVRGSGSDSQTGSTQEFRSWMEVGRKLDMARLVLNVRDLYLWPEGRRF